MSPRLDALIRDPVERTYLARDDGYWADSVLRLFAFLEGQGGRLQAIAFHQKGDYITYAGPWGVVNLEFFPDSYPSGTWIAAEARLRGERSEFIGDVSRLARERLPASAPPAPSPLDRETISSHLRYWAAALRASADLFDTRATE